MQPAATLHAAISAVPPNRIDAGCSCRMAGSPARSTARRTASASTLYTLNAPTARPAARVAEQLGDGGRAAPARVAAAAHDGSHTREIVHRANIAREDNVGQPRRAALGTAPPHGDAGADAAEDLGAADAE